MDSNLLLRIGVQIKKVYYTYNRYHTFSTFALIYHQKPLSIKELAEHVRISDHLIEIDENHCFITFSHTSQTNSYKAAQNLVYNLDSHFNDNETRIAIDTFNVLNPPIIVLNRLKKILDEIKRNSFTRVEDENILDSNIV